MKERRGFVSNSSSSSFIVALKNGGEVSRGALLEHVGIKRGSLAEKLFGKFFEFVLDGEQLDPMSVVRDHCYKSLEAFKIDHPDHPIFKYPREEWTTWTFSASNEDSDHVSRYIHDNGLDIDTPVLKVERYE